MCFLKHYLLNFFSVGKNIKEEKQKNDLRKKRKERKTPGRKLSCFVFQLHKKKNSDEMCEPFKSLVIQDMKF